MQAFYLLIYPGKTSSLRLVELNNGNNDGNNKNDDDIINDDNSDNDGVSSSNSNNDDNAGVANAERTSSGNSNGRDLPLLLI